MKIKKWFKIEVAEHPDTGVITDAVVISICQKFGGKTLHYSLDSALTYLKENGYIE